jgi:uncharacterized membrane protein YkvA (DUF1232 family)
MAFAQYAFSRDDQKELLDRFWSKLRRVSASIPFAEDLLTAYYCAFDRNTPLPVKASLIGALAYFVLPIDAIPTCYRYSALPMMPRCWRQPSSW